MTEQGKVVSVGSHEVVGNVRYRFRELSTEVPHVMRISPSGKSLATYDGEQVKIRVYDLGPSARFDNYRNLPVPDLGGPVKQLRWVDEGSAIALMSDRAVGVVTLDGSLNKSTATIPLRLTRPERILGIRSDESGFYIHTSRSPSAYRPRRQRVYYVPTGDWNKPIDVTPQGAKLEGLTTLDDSRLAMVVKNRSKHEFRIVSTKPGQVGKLLTTHACPTNSCRVQNWVPGASNLAVALGDGTLMWRLATPAPVVVKASAGRIRKIHSFWANPDQDLFLAADRRSVKVYADDGTLQWSWRSPAEDVVTAHFSEDEKGVLVATQNALILVENGQEIKRLATLDASAPRDAKGRDVRVFYDDVKPLGAGAVAWQEVRVFRKVTYPSGTYRRSREHRKSRVLGKGVR
jgi:hypothetical protein